MKIKPGKGRKHDKSSEVLKKSVEGRTRELGRNYEGWMPL